MDIHTFYHKPYEGFEHVAYFDDDLLESKINRIRNWCLTAFGSSYNGVNPPHIRSRWADNIRSGSIWFKKEADLTAFILKWS